ncbi:MAG: hypothetical protein QM788_10745 [Roseateles sp.]|uniref:hypothetical protein n=1 Tax=Roseateles sp. TaxID=1971397 RepID=UPI0039EAF849
MPTESLLRSSPLRLAVLAASAALAPAAHGQTDDASPFYVGGSLGASHVSNVYRQADATNSDTVTSIGLLAGVDKRLGRQRLTLDGSLHDNRYATNSDLNNRSHSIRGALNWETVGNLSGVLSARSDRSLADFNIGSGVDPIRQKNIESVEEYQAIARLGVATRYTLEGGWTHRQRSFTAVQYDRFTYRQDTASLGVYATPAGNVRLGLVARHTKGNNPRYPVGIAFDPNTLQPIIDPATQYPVLINEQNDYTRDDIDFTTRWSTGGSSTLNTRISRSRTKNSLAQLGDFSGTTGAIGWSWRPTGKLQLDAQYARDTGQETMVRTADLNRVYTSWQLGASYALTSKVSASARVSSNRARRTRDSGIVDPYALDDTTLYNIGVRWAISRGFSLGCQYDRASRDSSVPQYVYNASSYGCTGQALFF